MNGWYRIEAPHAVGAINFNDGKVVETAPIFRKLFMGRPFDWVETYVQNAEWQMTRMGKNDGRTAADDAE